MELPRHNPIFQAFSKVYVNTSHVIERAQGEEKKRQNIQGPQNYKQVKRKSVLLATSLDQFLEKQDINIGGEKEHDIHNTTDLPASFVREHNKGLDDLVEQEEIGEEVNSQNRKKQKWRHYMGPISFARVHMALRATKQNHDKPSQSEMFIATRPKTGKEVQADSQLLIAELQNH